MKIIISKDCLQTWLNNIDLEDEVQDHDLYDPSFVIETALNMWCGTVATKVDMDDEERDTSITCAIEHLGISAGRSEFDAMLYQSIYNAVDEMYETIKIVFEVFTPMLAKYKTVKFDQWLGNDIVLAVWE